MTSYYFFWACPCFAGSAHSGLRFARCFARFAPPCASRKTSRPEACMGRPMCQPPVRLQKSPPLEGLGRSPNANRGYFQPQRKLRFTQRKQENPIKNALS